MHNLWSDFLEQAREDWRAGNGREKALGELVAAVIFCALVAVGIVTAPLLIGPWL